MAELSSINAVANQINSSSLYFAAAHSASAQLAGQAKKAEKKEKSEGYISVLLMVILVSALSIIIAGIYGLNGMAEEPMVSVAIMRYIELPLGVLQRFDMLMVWFFMTGVFAVISGLLFRIRKQLFKVVSKEMGEIILFVIVIASLFVCRCLPEYAVTLDSFVVYGAFVDVPLSVLAMVLNGVKR